MAKQKVNKFEKRLLDEEKWVEEREEEKAIETVQVEVTAGKKANKKKEQEAAMQNNVQKVESSKTESIPAQDKPDTKSAPKVAQKGKKPSIKGGSEATREGNPFSLLDMVPPVERPMKVTKTFYLDADAYKWLEEASASKGMTPSKFVNNVVDILKQQEKQNK